MSDEATTLGKFNMSDFDDCEKLADDIKRRFMDMKWMAMNEIEEREAQPRLVLKGAVGGGLLAADAGIQSFLLAHFQGHEESGIAYHHGKAPPESGRHQG